MQFLLTLLNFQDAPFRGKVVKAVSQNFLQCIGGGCKCCSCCPVPSGEIFGILKAGSPVLYL